MSLLRGGCELIGWKDKAGNGIYCSPNMIMLLYINAQIQRYPTRHPRSLSSIESAQVRAGTQSYGSTNRVFHSLIYHG